jgi:hypothetical protein
MPTKAPPAAPPGPRYVALTAEARRCGLTAECLRIWGRQGKLKIYRAGRKCLLREGDVDKLLEPAAAQ